MASFFIVDGLMVVSGHGTFNYVGSCSIGNFKFGTISLPGLLEGDTIRWSASSRGVYSSNSFCKLHAYSNTVLEYMWKMTWSLWLFRNEVIFKAKTMNVVQSTLIKTGIVYILSLGSSLKFNVDGAINGSFGDAENGVFLMLRQLKSLL
ncbi:hypothetical protein V6N13_111246 [Hibiscus sabdariffa]